VVLRDAAAGADARSGALKREIAELCREHLAKHKVPSMIHFVPTLAVSASGKLSRPA
jgi:acyl-coenzyme A synthetase/AMP-(fatty) acid ligase